MTSTKVFDLLLSQRIAWYSYQIAFLNYRAALDDEDPDQDEEIKYLKRIRDLYIQIKKGVKDADDAENYLGWMFAYAKNRDDQNLVASLIDHWRFFKEKEKDYGQP